MIYCLPGLGTDHRIFQKLELGAPLAFLDWEPPLAKETLTAYSARMAARINQPDPILLGLSFGGVVAQEISQQISCKGLILISTLMDSQELPLQMNIWRNLPLYQLARGSWRVKTLPVWAKWFGIRKPEEIHLLQEMFLAAEDRTRIWAIRELIAWQPEMTAQRFPPYVRIHGKSDKVFPIKYLIESDRLQSVEEGNHFMVYQKADQISQIVQKFLHQLSS